MILAAAVLAAGLDLAPARPAILSNRWQEDWSALADPASRTEPLDRLKYIPLAPPEDATWLTLGGGLRERFETNNAPLFGTLPGRADSYVISRLEAHADLRAGPWQAFAQLQSDLAPGKRLTGPADVDRLDLEQAFVALVLPAGPGVLKLRAGRQQFAFDLQRFVSVRDGPNVRQSFDALWADYETGPWRFIAYDTQPVVTRDDRAFDDHSSPRGRFYGARIERHVLGDNELSAYWSRLANDTARFGDASGRERRDVWDVRFAGRRGPVDWDAETMIQSGRVGAGDIRAAAFGGRAGYTFDRPWTPRAGLQLDAASGDRKPGDGVLGTFNPLFPNGNYLTLAGYSGYANMVQLKPSVTVQPGHGLTLAAAAAAQWRATVADAVYAQPTVAVPRTAGQGSSWTGAYGQLRADWKRDDRMSLALEVVHFAIGRTIRQAGGHDADYLGAEIKYGW